MLFYMLLVLFVAGTAVHAASATAMSLNMALADSDATDMGDCDDCEGGIGIKASCDLACAAPLLASVAADTVFQTPHACAPMPFGGAGLAGRTGPPDLDPPRYPVLT